ncbi:amidase signature domain-containing protein [Lasiosphaeria ovina]|uniref:Amidase signature domain-containing protein n=1 Tax=Lasiosphaeria ovina TaxID=92902 RepID=A0AAE0MZ12_9PEZI|nr:amidase signature domain-containing protein [Lasiosphaeria ovina]
MLQLIHATIDDLRSGLDRGEFSCVDLVKAYKTRIEEVNDRFNAVIETNPEAETVAKGLDRELKASGPRGILHGIPFLLKDNIPTLDGTESTAGSYVLLGSKPRKEADIVERLRVAGAVILGKANLAEFSGFRSTNGSTGWSPRGGQVTGPYYENQKVSGSSSGSGVAVSLGLCAASIGTQTIFSIVNPSERNCVVGLKPTTGLLPSAGLIPVSHQQDVVGPIARCVRDVAHILTALADPPPPDYSRKYLSGYDGDTNLQFLQDVTIGVIHDPTEAVHPAKMAAFREAVRVLERHSARTTEPVRLGGLDEYAQLSQRDKDLVLNEDFRASMDDYLGSLAVHSTTDALGNIDSLHKLIEAIKQDPREDFPHRNVAAMEEAADRTHFDADAYSKMQAFRERLRGKDGLESALRGYLCDVFITPTNSWALSDFAAIGGNPQLVVPLGFYPADTEVVVCPKSGLVTAAPGLPFGLFMFGCQYGEGELLRVAHCLEKQTKVRLAGKPFLVPKTELPGVVASKDD